MAREEGLRTERFLRDAPGRCTIERMRRGRSRHRRVGARQRWLLGVGLVSALAVGCERRTTAVPTSQAAHPVAAAAARLPDTRCIGEGYLAPDQSGWGCAAGLRYLEVVRSPALPEEALPMVVMIHGLGDRPRPELVDLVNVAVPARIVMPQAPTPIGDGYSWFEFHVGDNPPEKLARGIAGASDQLVRVLNLLRRQRPSLGLPVVAGFSQGGMLSFALALHHPELVGFALPISGMLPEALWPRDGPQNARAPAIRALHGTADAIVPIAQARLLLQRLQVLGYDATLTEFEGVVHAISPAMEALVHEQLADAARTQAQAH